MESTVTHCEDVFRTITSKVLMNLSCTHVERRVKASIPVRLSSQTFKQIGNIDINIDRSFYMISWMMFQHACPCRNCTASIVLQSQLWVSVCILRSPKMERLVTASCASACTSDAPVPLLPLPTSPAHAWIKGNYFPRAEVWKIALHVAMQRRLTCPHHSHQVLPEQE